MSFYDTPDLASATTPNTRQHGAQSQNTLAPNDALLAETLGTGPAPWRRVETTLMSTASTMRQTYDACFAHLGLNLTQSSMLIYIIEFGPAAQSRIASHLGHGRAATGSAIDKLEQSGFVERLPDPTDRRVKLVQVTAEGLEMAEKLREIDLFVSKSLRDGITRSERRILASVLNRLQVNLLGLLEDSDAAEQSDAASVNTSKISSETSGLSA